MGDMYGSVRERELEEQVRALTEDNATLRNTQCVELIAAELDGLREQVWGLQKDVETERKALEQVSAERYSLSGQVRALTAERDGVRRMLADEQDEVSLKRAALAGEMNASDALRARVAELEKERDEARAELAAKTAVALQYETDLRRAESTARAAALKEAADTIRQGLAELAKMPTPTKGHESLATLQRNLLEKCVSEIEALATTPPPPVVPVAKAEDVLSRMYAARNHGDSGYNAGWSDAIRDAARDLGINLDGET